MQHFTQAVQIEAEFAKPADWVVLMKNEWAGLDTDTRLMCWEDFLFDIEQGMPSVNDHVDLLLPVYNRLVEDADLRAKVEADQAYLIQLLNNIDTTV